MINDLRHFCLAAAECGGGFYQASSIPPGWYGMQYLVGSRETVGSWLRGKSMAKHSRTSCVHNSIISEQNDDASFNKGSHEFRSFLLPRMEIHLMKTLVVRLQEHENANPKC